MPTSKSNDEKRNSTTSQTKTHKDRVEEYKLWNDDQTFKSREFERRRMEKIQKKGVLKADKLLQRAHGFYMPSILVLLGGTALLLYSSVDALGGEDEALAKNRLVVHIIGGVITGSGLLGLMATAAYTYRREDRVRKKNGFPSLFESSRIKGGGSMFGVRQRENIAVVQEFVDRHSTTEPLNDTGKPAAVKRMLSEGERTEATEPLLQSISSQLRESFSSASTTVTWLNRHEPQFCRLAPLLKRQTSDSALDQSFARSRAHTPEQSATAIREDSLNKVILSGQHSQDATENHLLGLKSVKPVLKFNNGCKELTPLERYQCKGNALLSKHQFSSYHCSGIEYQNKIANKDCVNIGKSIQWTSKLIHPSNPGMSLSSTDSSGYTSSECHHGVQPDLPRGSAGSSPHGRALEQCEPREHVLRADCKCRQIDDADLQHCEQKRRLDLQDCEQSNEGHLYVSEQPTGRESDSQQPEKLDEADGHCYGKYNGLHWTHNVENTANLGRCKRTSETVSSDCEHVNNVASLCSNHIQSGSNNRGQPYKVNSQRCGPPQVVISRAAVYATWTSSDPDSASLSPPVSPDISSLPYLSARTAPQTQLVSPEISNLPYLSTRTAAQTQPALSVHTYSP